MNQTLWQHLQEIPREDWPQYLKKNHRDLWLQLAWSKVNLWRDNQKTQSSILGDTPDYDRSLFTLDERANRMVNFAFEKYWQDGLIYKGSYLVNWSVGLQTAVSDVAGEIEFEKRVDPFVTFEYRPISFDINSDVTDHISLIAKLHDYFDENPIKVSTVRPETIFGDVALAIHSNILTSKLQTAGFNSKEINEAKNLIQNQKLGMCLGIKPLNVNSLKLIIAEEVDENFGSGVLKITPASDLVDYEIFNKYLGGDFPQAIGRNGKLTEACGNYAGLTVEQGRLAVIKRLAETGYIPVVDKDSEGNTLTVQEKLQILAEVKKNLEFVAFDPTTFSYVEGQKRLKEILGEAGKKLQIDWNYEHNVSICERSKTVIEPLISEEFFLSYHREIPPNPLDSGSIEIVDFARTWTLNFRTPEQLAFLESILYGKKTIETRALNPEEPDRYFGDIKAGDKVEFKDLVNSKTYVYSVQKAEIYKNLDEACKKGLDFSKVVSTDLENYTLDGIKKIYQQGLSQEYFEKIQKNGFVAIYLDKQQSAGQGVPENTKTTLQSIGLQAVEETNFYPGEAKERAINFLENIKDWCISRDLVWGHGIPIWYNLDVNPNKVFYSFEEYKNDEKIRGGFQISIKKPALPGNWVQEEKILDTWFSSCLWPLSTLDYFDFINGKANTDFETYYPTSDIVTGVDIFYQWIVRMMMISKYFTGKSPYQNIILNPTVRDDQGRKMSKSLGNGLDAVTQIEKYSSDSLRLAMLAGMIPNRNFRLGGKIADKLCEKYRNFGNKLWNVARFLENK